jgi:endonuclease/exonuclease/phosphatase family metal-dependent hydrolase
LIQKTFLLSFPACQKKYQGYTNCHHVNTYSLLLQTGQFNMKKILFSGLFTVITLLSTAQSSNNTLDVVAWNIEWFGSTSNGPSNDNLQEQNVLKVLRYLNADIYGLCEVVDTMRLRRVVDSLGSQYSYRISDYCSLAATPADADWLGGQKLAFIYNNNIFSNVSFRKFMGSSSQAYTNFASGRFPYLMNANVTINSITRNINFFMLHGKAGSTTTDYNRRQAATIEMKDSLDLRYPSAINLIIGDFNDDFDQTISTGSGTLSSYDALIKDSTDVDHYKSITLPLSYAGQASTLNYNDVIDHQVISNEASVFYVPGSAMIRTDVVNTVPNYVTTQNTSDHYPVFSQYNLANMPTNIVSVSVGQLGVKISPIPAQENINLWFSKPLSKSTVQLYDITGRLLLSNSYNTIRPNEIKSIDVSKLNAGVYLITIQTGKTIATQKIIKQ